MRRGISLMEVLVMLVPGLLLLGVAITAYSRMERQGAWNNSRLGAVDRLVTTLEVVRTDLACGQSGAVKPDGDALEIETVRRGRDAKSVTHRPSVGAGKRDAAVDAAAFAWRDEARGLLQIRVEASEGKGVARATPVKAEALVHLPDAAARAQWGSWADR